MKREDGVPEGRVRRAVPVARLTARTTGEAVVASLRRRVLGTEDPERHVRAAERYAELLGHSKGALMKAGQAVSFVSLGPAVPPEFQAAYQTALARLRDDAPPMTAEVARETLERELGARTEDVFTAFEWKPIAAARSGRCTQHSCPRAGRWPSRFKIREWPRRSMPTWPTPSCWRRSCTC